MVVGSASVAHREQVATGQVTAALDDDVDELDEDEDGFRKHKGNEGRVKGARLRVQTELFNCLSWLICLDWRD